MVAVRGRSELGERLSPAAAGCENDCGEVSCAHSGTKTIRIFGITWAPVKGLLLRGSLVTNKSFSLPRLWLSALLLLWRPARLAAAQGGGKAEPLRIEFKRGTNSTTINGKVRGTEEAEYVFVARKGQKLTIKLTSVPRRSSVFDLKAPDNADLGLEYDANYDYAGTLPQTGDYFLTVVRPTSSAGTSTYRMIITVR
jgi:hypothetical protein